MLRSELPFESQFMDWLDNSGNGGMFESLQLHYYSLCSNCASGKFPQMKVDQVLQLYSPNDATWNFPKESPHPQTDQLSLVSCSSCDNESLQVGFRRGVRTLVSSMALVVLDPQKLYSPPKNYRRSYALVAASTDSSISIRHSSARFSTMCVTLFIKFLPVNPSKLYCFVIYRLKTIGVA